MDGRRTRLERRGTNRRVGRNAGLLACVRELFMIAILRALAANAATWQFFSLANRFYVNSLARPAHGTSRYAAGSYKWAAGWARRSGPRITMRLCRNSTRAPGSLRIRPHVRRSGPRVAMRLCRNSTRAPGSLRIRPHPMMARR